MKRNLRNVFLLVVVLMTLAASKKDGYTVSGTVAGAKDGDTVLLVEMQGFGMRGLDTALVRQGKFVFEGEQAEPVWRFVIAKSGGKTIGGTDFILENGDITTNIASNKRTEAKGTPNNLLWNSFMIETEKQGHEMDPLWKIISDSTATAADRDAATASMKQLQIEQEKYKFDFIRQHIETGVARILLENLYMGYSIEQLEVIAQDFAKAKVSNDLTKTISKYVANMKKTEIGALVQDISLPNEKGEMLDLLALVAKNKITLVDMWASWCVPCRAEVPHLKEAYTDYRAKGFEIVGISLDQSGEAWKKAMVELEMPWPQMSDLKGWKSAAAVQYGIQAIPFTLLVDQQGKIVAKNLRGKALEEKLAELL